MDGVDQLNNILIIGMTNRLDMIDEALLRPGRLEVHMEISLPDRDGRLQILSIHTKKMRDNRILARDVDLAELAERTKNFSGAEIGGLIKSATSFAFNRHVEVRRLSSPPGLRSHPRQVGSQAKISQNVDQMQIGRDDFEHALEEVKPAFGVAQEELEAVLENGIIDYDDTSAHLLRTGMLYVQQVRQSDRTPLVSVLLKGARHALFVCDDAHMTSVGSPGSGKTALSARIASSSGFPYIKLISPETMVGYSESQKIAHIGKVFADSFKSVMSIVVVDNIERLIGAAVPVFATARIDSGSVQTGFLSVRASPMSCCKPCSSACPSGRPRCVRLARFVPSADTHTGPSPSHPRHDLQRADAGRHGRPRDVFGRDARPADRPSRRPARRCS